MKVRILGNSIRYRLKQPEVARFRQSGSITETTQLGNAPDAQICFTLQSAECARPNVRYTAHSIVVEVPLDIADRWTGSEDVGFDAVIPFENGKELKLLVEKDFRCIDRSEEDEVGSYPNPAEIC